MDGENACTCPEVEGRGTSPDRDYRLLCAGFATGFGGCGALLLPLGWLGGASTLVAVMGYALAWQLLRGRRG